MQPPPVLDDPRVQPPPITTPPPAVALPQPPAGVPGSGGIALPRSFVPAGGFVAPGATGSIPFSAPLVATSAAQAPADPSLLVFKDAWKDMQTATPPGGLDLAAIQNSGRKQAVPGAQGGYMPAQSGSLSVAGLGSLAALTSSGFFDVQARPGVVPFGFRGERF